jgi:ABC-type molybdate transport system substrate-binding protein
MMLYRLILCTALLAGNGGAAFAWNSPAPDVVLYCSPALDDALHKVADDFRAATGVEVHIFVAPPDGLIGLIKHRARDDVVVADTATIASLAAAGAVRPESVVKLGQDPFVLIAKAGAAVPRNAGVKQLVTAYPTVLPDPTTAASFDGAAVLQQDMQGAPAPHVIGVSDTPSVIARVRGDGTVIGLVHRTEAVAPGIAEEAVLAAAPTPVSGALVTNGQSANAARLLAYIAGPDGEAVLRKAGLEAMP